MGPSTSRAIVLSTLCTITLLALIVRVPSIAEPLGIDQGLLASGARALSRGQMLYRDVWDQKPPAIFLTYLAAFNVFGWNASSIAWLDLAASTLTAALLFAVVRRLGGAVMGAATATLYSALTIPSWIYKNGGFLERSVTETFIVACVGIAAWCAVRLRLRHAGVGWAALLGVSLGVAIVFKPNAGLYLPSLLLWLALYREDGAVRLIPAIAAAAAGSVVAPGLVLLWLWSHGVLPDARVALIDFNRFYVADNFTLGDYAFRFKDAVGRWMKTDPLWAAGGISVLAVLWDLVRARKLAAVPALAVCWGGAAALVIAVNGVGLYNTYFIQALAPLAVLVAWLLTGAAQRTTVHQLAAWAAVVVMILLMAQKNYPMKIYESARADFAQWLGRGDATLYLERFGGYATGRGYSARANAELAAYVRAHTAPDDLIYQFGINAAGIYFETDRAAAQRFLRVNEFVATTFPAPGFQLAAVTQELAAKRPRYLIFEQLHTQTVMANAVDHLQQDPAIERLLEAYRFDTQIEDFTLYRRSQ